MVRAAEFGTIRLPRGTRTTGAILTLREAHLSVRAIASALGIGVGTVHREIAAADQSIQSGNYTIGTDGNWQPARHPTPEIETGVPNGTPPPKTRVQSSRKRLSQLTNQRQVFQMEHLPSKTWLRLGQAA